MFGFFDLHLLITKYIMTLLLLKNNVDIECGYAKIQSVWTRVEMSPSDIRGSIRFVECSVILVN